MTTVTTFTRELLETKSLNEIRAIARMMMIDGATTSSKPELMQAILDVQDEVIEEIESEVEETESDDLSRMEYSISSQRVNTPNGERISSTIRVSCGASSGDFNVCGKTVGAISHFLREILNIDEMAQGVVNGQVVDDDYILSTGDNLEFLKPAGKKGSTFTEESLRSKSINELRLIARMMTVANANEVSKDGLIEGILILQSEAEEEISEETTRRANTLHNLDYNISSQRVNTPNGEVISSTIRVSCGASSGDFSVCGKTVGSISHFLREILNIDELAQGVVNGQVVDDDYVISAGDNLEFLKPAGKKGSMRLI